MTTVSNNSGFTLIELMIVLVIGGVLITLAASPYQKMQSTAELDRKAAEIVASLQIAKGEAAVRGVPVGCSFVSNGVYCFTRNDNQISAVTNVADNDGDGLLDSGAGDTSAIITQVRFNNEASIAGLAPINGVQGTGLGSANFYFLGDGSVVDGSSQPTGYYYTLKLGAAGNSLALDAHIRLRSTGSLAKEI